MFSDCLHFGTGMAEVKSQLCHFLILNFLTYNMGIIKSSCSQSCSEDEGT